MCHRPNDWPTICFSPRPFSVFHTWIWHSGLCVRHGPFPRWPADRPGAYRWRLIVLEKGMVFVRLWQIGSIQSHLVQWTKFLIFCTSIERLWSWFNRNILHKAGIPGEMLRRSRHTLGWPLPRISNCSKLNAFLITVHFSAHLRITSSSSVTVISLIDGSLLAQKMTLVPRIRSSRANGKTPRIISAPLLSTKITAHLWGGPCQFSDEKRI